jgi:hypothetical protein
VIRQPNAGVIRGFPSQHKGTADREKKIHGVLFRGVSRCFAVFHLWGRYASTAGADAVSDNQAQNSGHQDPKSLRRVDAGASYRQKI